VYELNAYTSDIPRMFNTYSEMHKNILTRFNKEGIEILSPHYQANRDGSNTTIPEEK
jgi:small-conductance mechanosensitive channel